MKEELFQYGSIFKGASMSQQYVRVFNNQKFGSALSTTSFVALTLSST